MNKFQLNLNDGEPIPEPLRSVQSVNFHELLATPENFLKIVPTDSSLHVPGFHVKPISIFSHPADAFVNTINCVGVMGAGIALEFKNRYPRMFQHYKTECEAHKIRPGDCYTYFDDEHHVYLLNLAVKDDWKYWGTLEWMEHALKSFKLSILENDIKSVNMPLIGGQNGRRGPHGKVLGMTPPPERDALESFLRERLESFAMKFKVEITLCIPENAPKKEDPNLGAFFTT